MSDNVISLVQKNIPQKGYIKIHYIDNLSYEEQDEIIQADSVGSSTDLPGFMTLWREDPDEPVAFINSSIVKKVEFLHNYSEGQEG